MIELSTRKWAAIKKTAQIVQPNVSKAEKLKAKINELNEELEMTESAIMQWDGAIINMTGFRSSDLIKRVVEPTGKTDGDGRTLTVTKWVPSDIVKFDEERNVYCIDAAADVKPSEQAEQTAENTAYAANGHDAGEIENSVQL